MKQIALAAVAALTLASCSGDRTTDGALIGAGAGAVIGGATTGTVGGAVVGAAAGGVAGAILGAVTDRPGYCYARDRYSGERIIVECPPGYR